jgi:hypothetical protein
MAALPPIRKLYIEDYASQKSWIGPFLIVMNTFMTTVVSALTKNLTLIDNTTSDVKYIQLSSVPTATAPVSVAWTKSIIPLSVIVGNVRLVSGATFTLSSSVQVQWQMSSDNKSLQITNIVGVTPTATIQYYLTLVCIAG